MGIWIKLLVVLGVIAAMLGLVYIFASPLSLLGFINRHTPGDGNAEQIADGIAYGTDPAQKLDVWAPKNRKPGEKLPVLVFYYGGG